MQFQLINNKIRLKFISKVLTYALFHRVSYLSSILNENLSIIINFYILIVLSSYLVKKGRNNITKLVFLSITVVSVKVTQSKVFVFCLILLIYCVFLKNIQKISKKFDFFKQILYVFCFFSLVYLFNIGYDGVLMMNSCLYQCIQDYSLVKFIRSWVYCKELYEYQLLSGYFSEIDLLVKRFKL